MHFERDDPNFYNSVGNKELNEKIAKNEVNSSRYEGTWKNKYLLAVAEEEIKKTGQQSPDFKFSYGTIEQIDDNYYNECKNIFIDYSLYHSNRGDIIVNYLKYHLDFYALLLFPFHFENISLYENVIVDHLNNLNFERIKEIFTKYNALEILTQDEKTIFIVAGEKQPKDFLDKIYKKFKESYIGDSCYLNEKYDIKTAENIIKIIFVNSNQTKQDGKSSPEQMMITPREVVLKNFREFIQFFFLYCVGLIEFYAFRQEVNTIEDECHKEINAVKESPASEHVDRAIGSIWTKAMINEEDYPDIEKRVKEEFARMKKARKNIIY